MMNIIRSILVILFIVYLFSTQNYFILSLGMNIICKQSERKALLSFKQDLKNSSNSLSSWSGENCCSWSGVICNNTTDHVTQLHLQELGLGGELNPSLQELKHLRHLDLSLNDFQGISIPDFLGSFQSLRYLNLSRANFSGMIPHQLGNLSNLRYLDLSSELFDGRLTVSNFQWISHLSSLKHLDLSDVNVTNASNWFHVVNMLPSLLVLRLTDCGLSGSLPTSLSHVNFTSLAVLDLRRNYFISPLPEWLYSLTNLEQLDLSLNHIYSDPNGFHGTISASIGNLTKLTHLDLSNNQLEGEIPITLGNLCKLQSLYLSTNQLSGRLPNELGRLINLKILHLIQNSFSGSIPLSIGRMSSLENLALQENKLNGSLPESLGNLSKLRTLGITENSFEGIVSEVHFANLTNLQNLFMDSLVLKISPGWVPPFQLLWADLGTCQLGPGFPMWLKSQKILKELGLSRTGISGTIPTWFWNFTTNRFRSDLSHNELHGELPKVINATAISLKSNQFSGQLPRVTPNVQILDLSNNSFSGPISTFLCNPISENNKLLNLDLSDNLLVGNLSDCWVYWIHLVSLRLGGNKITGKIPSSMGSVLQLQALHLSDNSLSGELPSSLRNCTSLTSINLGKNGFTGRLPIWLGESLQRLQFLRLRSNKFYGEIPPEFCYLASIRVLDIAHNDLRGSIPKCFNNFSAINEDQISGVTWYLVGYVDRTTLVTKGRELEYDGTSLTFVTNIDLSKNNLSGEIPEELTRLFGLRSLNLSENHFTGKIPEKIGNMSSLESLDFSNNNISGVIPQSISDLNFLSNLNLSYNNLSGKIPSSTQLQRLTEFNFIGNQDLCGPPLKYCNGDKPPQKPGNREVKDEDLCGPPLKYCNGDEPPQKPGNREVKDEDWFEMKWFYMSMGLGFAVGFWAFWGVIILKGSWRIAYFRFVDDMKENLYLLF